MTIKIKQHLFQTDTIKTSLAALPDFNIRFWSQSNLAPIADGVVSGMQVGEIRPMLDCAGDRWTVVSPVYGSAEWPTDGRSESLGRRLDEPDEVTVKSVKQGPGGSPVTAPLLPRTGARDRQSFHRLFPSPLASPSPIRAQRAQGEKLRWVKLWTTGGIVG